MSIGNATYTGANHRSDSEVCGSPAIGSPPRASPGSQEGKHPTGASARPPTHSKSTLRQNNTAHSGRS
jgi:hypothetical protein